MANHQRGTLDKHSNESQGLDRSRGEFSAPQIMRGLHDKGMASIEPKPTRFCEQNGGSGGCAVAKMRKRELPPTKKPIGIDVLTAAKARIKKAFELCPSVYLSFSAGKDSTVMLHLVADEARRQNRSFGVLIVDLEGQYQLTIEHALALRDEYSDCTDWYWVCLPISLRNAVSVYEPKWICWEPEKKESWIRNPPKGAIVTEDYFPFFWRGMEFEEFVPLFGEWYSEGNKTACFVGIRSDESLNRFRTITTENKQKLKGLCYTTQVTNSVYNFYPLYDWSTEDIWVYHAKNPGKAHNRLYDLMHKAGLSIHLMRICQPYGDDQRKGLWLFHLIEPQTWGKVVARVNGANSGSLYVKETGNINGYGKIALPPGHTWRSFAELLLRSLPDSTQKHYRAKIDVFRKWWMDRSYPEGIPDEADLRLENKREVPSWRRICKVILRNDYWCKGLSFTQHRSGSYDKYLKMMENRRKKKEWQINSREMFKKQLSLNLGPNSNKKM